MQLHQLSELRAQRRRRIIGFMPGRLYTADRSQEIYCRPLDVCPLGLGIFTEDEIEDEIGQDFVLIIAEREIELTRVYSVESPGLKVGYRHGFKVKDQSVDLEKMCIELGFI